MNQKLLIATLALIVGFGAGYIVSQPQKSPVNENSGHFSMHGEMNSMMAGLEGKSGDEFDRAFLSEMIVHHEGAVEMAEAALTNAKHQEIKDMANAIITAQNAEIKQMQTWQKSWYENQ